MQSLHLSTLSFDETVLFGEALGARLRGGEVIELRGDLGAGKTAFTTGLAKGVGSPDQVASPTFTISKMYRGSALMIHHFDFYRLDEPGLVGEHLHEALSDEKAVVVVEWGAIVDAVLPEDRICIQIAGDGEDEHKRLMTYEYPEKFSYVFGGIDS